VVLPLQALADFIKVDTPLEIRARKILGPDVLDARVHFLKSSCPSKLAVFTVATGASAAATRITAKTRHSALFIAYPFLD